MIDTVLAINYCKNMPELSRFLGISILMYFDDHNLPHFHVRYNDDRALVSISELTVLDGHLPARILGLVIEWAELHKEELMQDWDMVKTTGNYFKIDPLV
jgi:hypothetical protein